MSFKKRVELIGVLRHFKEDWDTEDYVSSGARSCFSELSSDRIQKQERLLEDFEKRREIIFKETSGRGHGAVLDQAEFEYSIDNLSRASTLFLCGPQYAEHLQQSLRRATAERGFFEIGIPGADKLMEKQFELYDKMQSSEIPAEDARFILPLNTKTTIQSKWNARELMHLWSMSQRMNIPKEVRETVKEMYQQAYNEAPKLMKDRKKNMEVLAWMPSPQLFAYENSTIERLIDKKKAQSFEGAILLDASGKELMTPSEIEQAVKERDEALLANMKHYHTTFLCAMSLAAFHQATRQRTWDQSVQALPDAVKRGFYITPPSIQKTNFENIYNNLNEKSIEFVRDNLNDVEALGVLPHSLKVYDLIHINGWNAIHSIGKRTCTEAQWEIRNVATNMADEIKDYDSDLGAYAVPQGKLYGKCPERKPCGKCFKKE